MAVKAPRPQRARIGEERSPGEVKPVTNRTIVSMGIGVLVLVILATTAILWASAGTKKRVTSTNNLPQGGVTTYVASYEETVQVDKRQVVSATLSIECSSTCKTGDYTGYAGDFTLKVSGSRLQGTAHPSCQNESLVLQADLSLAVPAQLPQTLTGTLTRSSTCVGTDPGQSATLELRRTR
ncbi:MAG TPA: hypothetical protein VHZ96_12755 [Frankiaceae bacterium]|jgi:hypothetical protein|nr:hypothetical protein [Frankiaceae bacterium]